MEKQPSLPIRLTDDDNNDKAAMVIQVKDDLNKLLDSAFTVNEESEQISELPSIYKIPHFMRETHSKAFEPQLVSFGPYHHGKQHLSPMEPEKVKVFHSFMTDYQLAVEFVVMSVSSILEDLLGSYNMLEEEWKQNRGKFLQLMIVDGCFMLGHFTQCPTSLNNMSMDINRDILLLENQLPIILLEMLYSIAGLNQRRSQDLKWLVCNWFSIPWNEHMEDCKHILDMYKESLLHPLIDWDDKSVNNDYSDPESQVIPPATQLHEAGIKFERSKTDSLTDVSFDPKKGVLRLPHLAVDDDTESIYLNVMAFEKLHVDAGCKVTSFIILMNNLIDNDRDVALLSSDKILSNALGNDSHAADMFNQLGFGAALGLESHMAGVHQLVNQHCSKSWNKLCATLKHDYFQSPWTIISLCAAIFGFIILILQAIYQFLDYYLKT